MCSWKTRLALDGINHVGAGEEFSKQRENKKKRSNEMLIVDAEGADENMK